MKGLFLYFLLFMVLAGEVQAQPAGAQTQAPPDFPPSMPEAGQIPPAVPPGSMPPQSPPPNMGGLAPGAPPAMSMDPGFSGGAMPQGMDDATMVIQPSPEGYTYDPTGRRDPFKPYGQSQQVQVVLPQREESPDKPPMPTDPLQMFDISQFRLVGIIWQVKNPKAVVRDPIGKMHLIYRETKIGRNSGFVASIREGEVIVVEPTVAENGLPSAITRTMTLKK